MTSVLFICLFIFNIFQSKRKKVYISTKYFQNQVSSKSYEYFILIFYLFIYLFIFFFCNNQLASIASNKIQLLWFLYFKSQNSLLSDTSEATQNALTPHTSDLDSLQTEFRRYKIILAINCYEKSDNFYCQVFFFLLKSKKL